MPFLKYFYIVVFSTVLVAVLVFTIFGRHHIENGIIEYIATHNNEAIAEGFTKGIWKKYRKTLSSLPCEGINCPNTKKLENDYKEFFNSVSLLKHDIHLDNNYMLFGGRSSVNDEDGKESLRKALKGEKTSSIIIGYSYEGKEYNVVRSFIPIIPDRSSKLKMERIPAVIEAVYDITPFWDGIGVIQVASISTIIAIFALILLVTYVTIRRIERLLTKQYEANVELTTAKTSAEQESQAKSQFLANVSHELRTPLNSIIGFSEILKDEVMGPIENKQYKEYITDIHSSGVHLLSLINDILDFSKAEAGKLDVNIEEIDVTKIIKSSIRLVSPRANEAGVNLIEDIPEQHYILKTDGKRLKQVMLNLMSNSVKFTPEGGAVTLSAWKNLSENTFAIQVKDTGVGIAPKDISKVMATFGQVENKLSRKYEGTGLGLPLTKKLVELMGGTLDIESEESKGTTITINLPYEEANDEQ